MIQEIVKAKVSAMAANGDSFTFLHSEKNWQNLEADEATLPAVYLDMPIKYKPVILTGGVFSRAYVCVVLFLYKSELDNDPDEQYINYAKAEAAQREFQLLCENDIDIKSIVVGDCYQILNLFDCNLDGVVMPFTLTPRNSDGVCLP